MEVIYTLNENQLNELVSLYQHEWWTKERSFADTKQCVEASQVLIGLVDDAGSLIAFARVLSDFTFKALIFDVIVSGARDENKIHKAQKII